MSSPSIPSSPPPSLTPAQIAESVSGKIGDKLVTSLESPCGPDGIIAIGFDGWVKDTLPLAIDKLKIDPEKVQVRGPNCTLAPMQQPKAPAPKPYPHGAHPCDPDGCNPRDFHNWLLEVMPKAIAAMGKDPSKVQALAGDKFVPLPSIKPIPPTKKDST